MEPKVFLGKEVSDHSFPIIQLVNTTVLCVRILAVIQYRIKSKTERTLMLWFIYCSFCT